MFDVVTIFFLRIVDDKEPIQRAWNSPAGFDKEKTNETDENSSLKKEEKQGKKKTDRMSLLSHKGDIGHSPDATRHESPLAKAECQSKFILSIAWKSIHWTGYTGVLTNTLASDKCTWTKRA